MTTPVTYSRRALVVAGATATVAGIAGLAGCSDRRGSPTGTATQPSGAPPTTTPTPNDTDVPTLPTEPSVSSLPPTSTVPVDAAYFPPLTGEWETVPAAAAGFTDAGVAALVDMVGSVRSDSFMMLWQGRIVVEQYWRGADETFRRDVASVQKSVSSTLLGLARDRGLLAFDDPASDYLGAGWTASDPSHEATITVRQLMTMSSGLNPIDLTKDAEPGVVWDYNTDAYQKLRGVLEVAAGTEINTLCSEWLFDTIGITQPSTWVPRGNIVDAVGDATFGLRLTAREMSRFGLFAMHRGRWADQQVTATDWFDEAWASCPLKRDYGYLWWLLGKGHLANKGAPPDLVAGLGAQDQKIYVSPASGLVLVRQGDRAGEVSEAESDFDAALITALVDARV